MPNNAFAHDALPPDTLSLSAAIGQIICPTLYHGLSRDKPYDPVLTAALLDRHGWGGYIVFRDDVQLLRARLADLSAHTRIPLLIAADMEHGAGQQLAGLSAFPPAMAFGATGDPALAHALGVATATEALAAGVNWILAPVADVTNNPANPIINIRSFGGDALQVAAMVAAFVQGCQSAGALACAKHFPGHGDTETDSHTRLGCVTAPLDRLEAVEFPPFRAALEAGVASIMTAHLGVPALDAADLPATLSRAVMTDLLRDAWGFDGLVVTDALVMGGITESFDPLEAAVQAVAAGCDVLLMPPDPVATAAALAHAIETGRLPEARVREAAGRVLAAKARLKPLGAPSVSLAPGAADLAAHVAARALTLAQGPADHRLPDGTLAIAVDDGAEFARLDAFMREAAAHGLGPAQTVSRETTAAEWDALTAAAAAAPAVVLGVFSPIRVSKDRSLLPEALLAPLRAITAARPTTVVSFASPFLVAQLPGAEAWVLAYGSQPVQVAAAFHALRGGAGYPGRSPVALPAALAGAAGGHEGPSVRGPGFA